MNSNLLEVSGLHVSAGEKEILHGVDLTVGKDETHVLMGPNGTGKSTLGYAIGCRSTSARRRAFFCRFRIRSKCPA